MIVDEDRILTYFKTYDGIRSMRVVSQDLKMNYKKFKKIAKRLNVWRPNQSGKGKIKSKFSLDDIFSNKVPMKSAYLKNRLIKEGLKENKCEECKIENWNNKKIVFELDHIDGNNKNNAYENLKILCPNCHSQTPTFRGRKVKTECVV